MFKEFTRTPAGVDREGKANLSGVGEGTEGSGEVLLEVRNHHTSQAGTPLRINDDDPNQYIGYFENRFGEQAIVFDCTTQTANLHLGDAGWETSSYSAKLSCSGCAPAG